jgi:broad specificity phosphatase PhoE
MFMIYLVRHGETDWNLFKRCNGTTETFLNKTGLEQAKMQAENLKNINFNICFCSSQIRARQFSKIIYKGETVFDERLAEIYCGEFEGMVETAKMMKLFWQAVQTGDKGTENINVFIQRNCEVCNIIAEKYKGKNVLIITHAANARVVNYYFTGKPEDYDWNKQIIEKGELIAYEN